MEVLSEIIECSVCLERMDTKSRVLPCQHTFCSDCLHRIAIQNKNELKCPECRYVCNIPVRDLPANILLIRLLEGMKTAGKDISSKREMLREAGTPCAEAMYTYEPQEQGDLRFRRGDLIFLKKRLDENWYVGELNGRSGYLPATYVKVICPFPVSTKSTLMSGSPSHSQSETSTVNSSPAQSSKVTVKALYDFEMKHEEKEDCLKFKKDASIELMRRIDQNWAEGRLSGVIGIFPLNYVKVTEAARALLDIPQTRVTSSPGRTSLSVNSSSVNARTRNVSGPAILNSSEQAETNLRVEQAIRRNSSNTSSNITEPNAYISVPSSGGTSQTQSTCPASDNVFHSTVSPESTDASRSRPRSSEGALKSGEETPSVNKIGAHSLYRAMHNYKPNQDDELALARGTLYHVTDRCKDGWYKGRCVRTGTSGVFPGNYVQLVPPDSEGATGDALFTMRRGRLEPPSEKQTEKPVGVAPPPNAGSKAVKSNGRRLEENRRLWGMDVVGCSAPSPKMRSSARRNVSVSNRDRRRSSSLSRLENQSPSVIRSHDLPPKPSRKLADSHNKPSKATRMRYICVMAYPAQGELELDLKVGDVVVVLKRKFEGWYKGTNETTRKTGIFPACFVQSFTSNSNNESRSS